METDYILLDIQKFGHCGFALIEQTNYHANLADKEVTYRSTMYEDDHPLLNGVGLRTNHFTKKEDAEKLHYDRVWEMMQQGIPSE